MSSLVGADADELDRLGVAMRTAAERLDAMRGRIFAGYSRTRWEGHDGEHHRSQWNYRLSGMVQTAVLATHDAAVRLHLNADQQRRASGFGYDAPRGTGWPGPVAGGSSSTAGIMWEYTKETAGVLVTAAGQLMLAPALLDAFRNQTDVARFLDRPAVDWLLKKHKLSNPLGRLGAMGDAAGVPRIGIIGAAGLVMDGTAFVTGLATDPHSPDTYKAGIDTAFSLAEAATLGCLPLSAGIGVIHLGYDIVEHFHPGAGKEAFEAMTTAGIAVAHVATDVVETGAHLAVEGFNAEVHAAQTVAHAAVDIASNGVNAVKNFFHW